MKLGIGTAQFGRNYGAFNKKGQINISEAKKILDFCLQVGINVIDTAALYGESEKVIGHSLPANGNFKIITKTPHFKSKKISLNDVEFLKDTFKNSLKFLGQECVYALLIHNAEDLMCENGYMLLDEMQNLKKQGFIKKVGVSVYTASQIEKILGNYNIDIIQVPISIFDQRLVQNGYLRRLKEKNVEIHARSVFLQGLILADPRKLHRYFNDYKDKLTDYHSHLRSLNISPMQAALGFLKQIEEVDTIIVGIDSIEQLQEIVAAYHHSSNLVNIDYSVFAINDENLVNPVNWKI